MIFIRILPQDRRNFDTRRSFYIKKQNLRLLGCAEDEQHAHGVHCFAAVDAGEFLRTDAESRHRSKAVTKKSRTHGKVAAR